MVDGSGTTMYTYDNVGRLKTKATPQGTLSYTYDAAGNVASIVSSNGNGVSVSYTYDESNRLVAVIDNRLPAGQNTTTYAYDSASNLVTMTYPNSLQSTYSYDNLNRLKSLPISKGTTIASYQYQLGPAGNRQSVSELSGRTVNWSYDGISRLTNETVSGDPIGKNGSVAYGFDPAGNRLSVVSTLAAILSGTFSYDANDRVSTETYDNNGNTLTSGGKVFRYTFENRVKDVNNGQVQVVYDGDGNRVMKMIGGVTTRYLVDDLSPTGYAQVVEELVSATVQRTYTFGTGRISQNNLVAGTWVPSFYGYDGAGNVRLLTDATGAVTDTYDYDGFGNVVNSTGATPNNYLYRGEQFDPDVGFYYLRARYFNPGTGRFVTRDPFGGNVLDPVTLHKYLYAGGDPINGSDPSGKFACPAFPCPGPLPPGPEPVPEPKRKPGGGGGDIIEYALLLALIVDVTIGIDPALAKDIEELNCIWQKVLGTLEAAGGVDSSGGTQQAGTHVRKGCSGVCTYGCNVHIKGYGDHGGDGQRLESTVDRGSCAISCAVAIKQVEDAFAALKLKDPRVDHLHHRTEIGSWGGRGQCHE